jgi:hypothetical protein
MTKESKVAVLGLGGGFLLFVLLNKTVLSKSGAGLLAKKKKVTDEEIQIAIDAYQEALNNNEPEATLNALNNTLSEKYNVQVHREAATGNLIVTDIAGNTIATYQF